MKFSTGFLLCLVCLVLAASVVLAEKKAPTKLQIGVKKRIPDEACPRKSKSG